MNIPFLNFAPMHQPIEAELQQAFTRVLKKNWFILGNELEEFEIQYSGYNGVGFSVGVSNGLDALHLFLCALGIGLGDEVIVPSNTYMSSVLSFTYVNTT